MIEKLGAVHLIKFYGSEGKFMVKVPESTYWYFTIIVNKRALKIYTWSYVISIFPINTMLCEKIWIIINPAKLKV